MKLTIPFLIRNSSFDFLYKNYKIIEYVGKGQFGNTYKVENIIDKKIWLAKCIDLSQMDEDDKNRSLQEAEIMKNINNPYVIQCHESFIHDEVYLVIIMEYCKQGDIGRIIDSCITNQTFLSEKIILKWCSQLAAGLYYLHNECKIIHRDIKPSNIFITENGDIVIGDFGISRIMLSVSMPFTLTSIGTPQYMSPEMCENKPYTYKCDIWSFGCVLYELTSLKPPFSGDSLLSLAWNISFHEIEPLPSCYSNELFVLIKSLLSRDPMLRPNPVEILNNKLIQSYKASLLFLPIETSNKKDLNECNCEIEKKKTENNYIENEKNNFFNKNNMDEKLIDLIDKSLDIKNYQVNYSVCLSNSEIYKFEKFSNKSIEYKNNNFQEKDTKTDFRDNSTASISTSSTFSINSHTKLFENNILNNQNHCDRLFNYEHQYFSVLIGRIQHYIISFIKNNKKEIYTKDEMLNYLFLNLKCCSLIDINNTNMTALWFSEFVNELDIGISEIEQSLFLSYIGYFIHSQINIDLKNKSMIFNNKINSKIRHTKSSESLLSLSTSKNKKYNISTTDLFELNSDTKSNLFNEDFYDQTEINNLRLPKIYDFIEKISTWNKIKINNKSNDMESIEDYYKFDYNNLNQEDKISISLPNTPKINEIENFKVNVKPYFYLFITDWIQNILKPILSLNDQKISFSQKRFKNITLREGFHLFDHENNGVLSRQHFRTVLYLILPKLTSIQLDWLFALSPKDIYGNVKYEQFLRFIDDIQQNGKINSNITINEKFKNERIINKDEKNEINVYNNEINRIEIESEERTTKYQVDSEMIPGTVDISYELFDELENYNKLTENNSKNIEENELKNDDNKINEKESIKNYKDNGIREELYGYGIQDVVLLHNNNQTYLRPSPSPQLLSRTRNQSFIRNSSNIIGVESLYRSPIENKNIEVITTNILNNQVLKKDKEKKNQKIEQKTNLFLKDEFQFESMNIKYKDERVSSETVSPIKSNTIQNNLLSILEINHNLKIEQFSNNGSLNIKIFILQINIYLEKLIQSLQIEMLYTCWTTAKAPENNLLYNGMLERLKNIRYDSSEVLDQLISYLSLFEKENSIKVNLSNEILESIFELNNILLVLKIELPLQRDAIDCILKIIDNIKFPINQESIDSIYQETNYQNTSRTSIVYKQIMKQAITNNIVLTISNNKYNINGNSINKNKLVNCNNSQNNSIFVDEKENNNLINKNTLEENKLNMFNIKNVDYKNVYEKLNSTSKDFDWSGKFLASFEFFGETTVNLIQYSVNILSIITQSRETGDGNLEKKKEFSKTSYLIENYRQWSYLKEHVSRECAFVASIGVNYNLKNDLETARIFLELLGARRYQATVTLQQQSLSEQKLFRELFLLEESLWNNQKFIGSVDDSSKQKTDSEHWLIKGEQTCAALHKTCIKFVEEIKLIIENSQEDIFSS